MSVIVAILSAVFWGLLVLSILVVVHEGGHFTVARISGMRVTEFFLGLPCRIKLSWKSRRLGTEFGVTPFLLGGYNRITGMEGNTNDPHLAAALAIVQREGRVAVCDLARELGIEEDDAYGLMATLTDMASIRPYFDESLGEYAWQKEWPRSFETLARDGQLRTEYDRGHDFSSAGSTGEGEPHPVDDPEAFFAFERSNTYAGKGFVPRVLLLVMGPLVNIVLAFSLIAGSLMIVGVEMSVNTNVVGSVSEGSLAQEAGLQGGDRVLMVGGQEVASWVEVCEAIDVMLAKGEDFSVAYERDGETFETTIDVPEGEDVSLIGVNPTVETYHPTLAESTGFAFSYVRLVGKTVARLLMPQHTIEVVSKSSSIVGISAMASEAAASGIDELVRFAAAVSMSLGFMNLLPLPPLDGGQILLECIRLVTRKPVSEKAQTALTYAGLAFILFIFCFALRNDIVMLMSPS